MGTAFVIILKVKRSCTMVPVLNIISERWMVNIFSYLVISLGYDVEGLGVEQLEGELEHVGQGEHPGHRVQNLTANRSHLIQYITGYR
jgi:hypothetical protein